MKWIILLFLYVGISSCARVEYLSKQGLGQLKILNSARPNAEILARPNVPFEAKKKIELIQTYKRFFYKYWQKKEANIYQKTTMLDRDAVSYLVIRSPLDKIEALEECFPIVGCFPYLGFFDKKDALDYAGKYKAENQSTWVRPVYAYSTLGTLPDPILSSFFDYDELELADLVFHELFHTIFFLKNNVDLNETLASFFSEKMADLYFQNDTHKFNELQKRRILSNQLNAEIVKLAQLLKEEYAKACPCSVEKSSIVLQNFLSSVFTPKIKAICEQQSLSTGRCRALEHEWNNAAFAAFLTYEEKNQDVESLFKKQGGDLKKFLKYIEQKWDAYEESGFDSELFTEELFKK